MCFINANHVLHISSAHLNIVTTCHSHLMLRSHECCLVLFSSRSFRWEWFLFRRMYLGSRNICPKYDVFHYLTIFNNCYKCVLARSNISPDMCLIQEILRRILSVHTLKASILLRDLSDQIFASYNSIGYTFDNT
jgi:hypothetical protein